MMPLQKTKNRAIALRKRGLTYADIKHSIGINIPKSTLSYWCKNVQLSPSQRSTLAKAIRAASEKGRMAALAANQQKRIDYFKLIEKRIGHLPLLIIKENDIKKIVVATLYLGEGAKNRHSALSFGNSNPDIVKLFLRLLRSAYSVDESRLRCTVQCRADQNITELEQFWSKTTSISIKQFYKTRIDPRTIGRPSKKMDYKGVCRLEYFSADTYHELTRIGDLICKIG